MTTGPALASLEANDKPEEEVLGGDRAYFVILFQFLLADSKDYSCQIVQGKISRGFAASKHRSMQWETTRYCRN